MQNNNSVNLDKQLQLEYDWRNQAKEKMKQIIDKQVADGIGSTSQTGKRIVNGIHLTLAKSIHEFITSTISPKRGVQPEYRPILIDFANVYGQENLNDLSTLVSASTLQVTLNMIFDKTNSYSNIALKISQDILNEVNLEKYIKENSDGGVVVRNMNKRNHVHYRAYYLNHLYKEVGFDYLHYTKKQLISLGGNLLELLSKAGLVDIDNRADVTTVVPSSGFLELWNKTTNTLLEHAMIFTPTIIPPKPWTGMYDGGYYGEMQVSMIRLKSYYKGTRLTKNYIKRLSELDLSKVEQALNKVQSTAYKVNKNVLAVVEQIMNNGISLAGIPSTEPLPEIVNNLTDKSTQKEIRIYKDKVIERIYEEGRRKSHVLRLLMILGVVREFKNYDKIYFPCNMDFRGRIYPVPTWSYQGDDLSKALIEYATPAPATDEKCFDSLCIQGANHAGVDKVTFADRIQWVQDHHEQIIASATSPLDCLFWADTDEPLQFLAWAFEYKKALEYKEQHNNSIVGFECGHVIAFDGTCSGLQHYSAMLRDEVGGSAVNLIDHEKPSDIYQIVADKVKTVAEQDAISGTVDEYIEDKEYTKYGTKFLAQTWLNYGITRKVTKRSVMTLAYGSKQYGFAEQIYEDTTKNNDAFNGFAQQAARYLARLIWEQVQEVIVSASQGMKYLQEMAKVIVDNGYFIEWTTPLGLVVQQQYMNARTERFQLRIRNSKVRRWCYCRVTENDEEASKREQVQGIAPNFIHSLDATHLMMTINATNFNEYTTVHDSFGTSLGNAEALSTAIRKQFQKLYTAYSPLDEFEIYTLNRVGYEVEIPEQPKRGNLDLGCVLTSKYIFH